MTPEKRHLTTWKGGNRVPRTVDIYITCGPPCKSTLPQTALTIFFFCILKCVLRAIIARSALN